jgi:hypothetical protein
METTRRIEVVIICVRYKNTTGIQCRIKARDQSRGYRVGRFRELRELPHLLGKPRGVAGIMRTSASDVIGSEVYLVKRIDLKNFRQVDLSTSWLSMSEPHPNVYIRPRRRMA